MRRDTANESLKEKIVAVAQAHTQAAGLVYVSDDEPGITRLRRGKGFRYLLPDGRPLTAARELQRIRSLAIPPAYTQVWISPDPRGHIQATGRDARGRKQYRYHARWRETRDRAKFDRMLEFGQSLKILRKRIKADLALSGLPRDKVLATVVSLLDHTNIRIGNLEYVRSNKSFGLTTLLNRHVKFLRAGRAVFRFRGKSGVLHEVEIDDRRLVRIVRSCQELAGQRLFQFTDESGAVHTVDSTMVNEYLREIMGMDFTAKDFRTWAATVRAVELLQRTPVSGEATEAACRRCIAGVVRIVAEELKNTPAVCRKSYINPLVFEAWRAGTLLKSKAGGRLGQGEQDTLAFLKRRAKGK